ncbi:hypothetical protein PENTCL1PPCAC_10066, partial [Pristionchus entomophagus]
LRQLPYLAVELVVWLFIVGVLQILMTILDVIIFWIITMIFNAIDGTDFKISMISSWVWMFVLVMNQFAVVVHSINVMRLFRGFFNVDRSEEEILAKLDQLLQLTNTIQRMVENCLAAGATRDQLRDFEEVAVFIMDSMSTVASSYESNSLSNRLCKLKYRVSEFMFKIAQIDAVCERITYLCRPAVGA